MSPQDISGLLGTEIARIPAPPRQVAVGIPADLLRRRPDIRSAEYKAVAQCAQIGVATADLLPAFSLSGSFGYSATNVGAFSLSDMWDYRARTGGMGPSFQWNILNYGRIINNIRAQDARFQETLLSYQDTVLRAQREVENALIAFINSQRRAQFLAGSCAAAKRSLDLAVLQYQQGITDFTTVLTAEQELLTQQNNLVVTQGDISQNLVSLYRAFGGGWEIREGKDFVPGTIQEQMKKRTYWGGLLKRDAYASETGGKPAPPIRLPDL
jgi:outer membrane protein TolC